MLFSKKVYDEVLLLLSQKPNLTVKDIYNGLPKGIVSLPNLYKVLGELLGNDMLLKEDHLYRINQIRLNNLQLFINTTKNHYKQYSVTQDRLEDGEKIVSYALGFRGFEHLMVEQYLSFKEQLNRNEPIYYYNSHLYFPLTSQDPTKEVMRMFTTNSESYGVVGSNSIPDQYAVENDTLQGYHTVINEKAPFLKEGYCLIVQDEYIFEALFPSLISNHFKVIFDASKSMENFNYAHYQQILDIKAKYKITVRRDKKEAENLKKVMKRLYEQGVRKRDRS